MGLSVKHKKMGRLILTFIALFIILLFLLNSFIIGFLIDKNEIDTYITLELADKYQIKVVKLTESESEYEGQTISRIYKIIDDTGDESYLATALLKSLLFSGYKVTSMFILPENVEENDAVLLVAEGYIKSYMYDVKNQHLDLVDAYNRVTWKVPIVSGLIVFLISIMAMIYNDRKKKQA